MIRLLNAIERAVQRLRMRLVYPAARYERCRLCGGPTCMQKRLP